MWGTTDEGRCVCVYQCLLCSVSCMCIKKVHLAFLNIFCTDVSKYGIAEVNAQGKITSFVEKPLPSATQSRLVVSGVWCEWSEPYDGLVEV